MGELFECEGDYRLNRGSFLGLGCLLVGCRLGFGTGLWLWRICGGFLGFAYVYRWVDGFFLVFLIIVDLRAGLSILLILDGLNYNN